MFGLQRWQVENTVKLIDEGNTIPFIARYRKEAHGTLDDQVLRELSEKLEYLRNLDKRREQISASITAQAKRLRLSRKSRIFTARSDPSAEHALR